MALQQPHVVLPRMDEQTEFVPRGAIAFFAAMMLFYAAVWLLIMGIMIARG